MNVTTREFETLDIVTVTTGRMVSDRGIDSVYDVCGFVLNDPGVMTHQLPSASRVCEPALYKQHPWLRDLDPPRKLPELKAWCAALVEEHGPRLVIEQVGDGETAWLSGNGLRDLLDIAGGRPVIIVEEEE